MGLPVKTPMIVQAWIKHGFAVIFVFEQVTPKVHRSSRVEEILSIRRKIELCKDNLQKIEARGLPMPLVPRQGPFGIQVFCS